MAHAENDRASSLTAAAEANSPEQNEPERSQRTQRGEENAFVSVPLYTLCDLRDLCVLCGSGCFFFLGGIRNES
jgi:hypothetical protein